MLELGAGTGFVGLSTLPCGSSYVFLTDLEYALDVASVNVKKNGEEGNITQNQIEVRALDWFDEGMTSWTTEELESIDVLLAADVIWQDVLVVPLARTIERLLQVMEKGRQRRRRSEETEQCCCYCFVMYTSRYGEEFDAMVLNRLQEAGLVVEEQPHEEMDAVYRYDEAVVWRLKILSNAKV